MRKPAFCIYENKDQRGNHAADQGICLHYTGSSIHLLLISEISSLLPSSVAVQSGLCRTWSETPEDRFSDDTSQMILLTRFLSESRDTA